MTRAPGTKDSVVAVARQMPEVDEDFIGCDGTAQFGSRGAGSRRSDRRQDVSL